MSAVVRPIFPNRFSKAAASLLFSRASREEDAF